MKTKTIITAIGLATFMMSCNSPSETPVKIAEVETKEEIKGLVQEELETGTARCSNSRCSNHLI